MSAWCRTSFGSVEHFLCDIGDNAVADWHSRIVELLVRHAHDVDILVRRSDPVRLKQVFENTAFVDGSTIDGDFLLDVPNGKIRDRIHLLMAGGKVEPEYALRTPHVTDYVTDSERGIEFQVFSLQALVEIKLNSSQI